MSFRVNLAALTGLPDLLDRRAADLFTAHRYLDRYASLAWTGLANELAGSHRRVVGAIGDFLDQSHACARRYGYAVAGAMRYYLQADAAAAARTDAALPGAPLRRVRSPVDPSAGPEIFVDLADPTDALAHPRDHSFEHPYHPVWYDLASPTSIERDIVWRATTVASHLGLLSRPIDIFADFTTFYCGPWADILACADVFTCLAALCRGEGDALRHGADALERVWTGQAADSCDAALREFAADLAAADQPLLAVASSYRRTAHGMVEQSTVMGQLLAQLVDVAAELVIDAASEGAAAVITAPDSALECARLVVAGLRTLHVTIELIHAGRDEAAALAQGLGAIRAAFRPPPLPAGIPALPVPIR